MTAKRLLIAVALAALAGSTGCRTWCEHHYPCQTACAPCCAPASSGYAPPPAPPIQAAAVSRGGWGETKQCTCTCP